MKEWQKLIELPPVTGAQQQLRSAETLEREREGERGREIERDPRGSGTTTEMRNEWRWGLELKTAQPQDPQFDRMEVPRTSATRAILQNV